MIVSAFGNILTNAIKFTPEGGTVTVRIQNGGRTTKLIIADEGIGISKKLLPKILSSQHRFSTERTNNEKGTGLGLILTKNFIEQNGGTLSVDSVPKKGTTVTVELPKLQIG
jgi:signal transduction histidine kinase